MFVAARDLRREWRRFVLLGVVVALVALLSTVLSGLATGLVTDGISGLRALPAQRIAFEPGAKATFSRSTLTARHLRTMSSAAGVEATPLGVSFVNATSRTGGPSLDIALFGVAPDSFLLPHRDAPAMTAEKPGLLLDRALENDGVKTGDRYELGGSSVSLPVLGFIDAGTYGHAAIAFLPLATWQQVQYGDRSEGRFSAVALRGDQAAIDRAGAKAGVDVLTKSAAYAGSPGYAAETTTMTLIRAFLLVISGLVVGAFFTVLTVQRTRQIGLLKAMGASNGYIARDSVGQMTVLVAIATAVGTAAGSGIVAVLSGDAPVELSPRSIGTVAVLLVASGVVGSLAAVRRITQVEPAVALGVEP